MQTSKITSFDLKEPFKGQNSAFVGLENKDWGFYEYKGEPQFKVNDEVEYEIEVSRSDKGTKIHKITLKLVSETQQKGVETETKATPPVSANTPQSNDAVRRIKSEAAIRMMERAMDLFVKEDLDWDKMQERQEYVTRLVWGEIDEIYGLK